MLHHDFPPYEVISTAWLSFKELLELKDIENVLEQYYNSGRFRHTLDFLLQAAEIEPFDFYRRLSEYWNQNGHFSSSNNVNEIYTILKCFAEDTLADRLDQEQFSLLNEYMKLDWLLYARSGSMPAALSRFNHAIIKEEIHGFIKNELTAIDVFKDLKSLTLRELLKQVGYEVFLRNIFADTPSKDEIVMFFPLRPSSSKKRISFTAIPLKEIITH
ncbi:MAG TPA: DUF4080 domain-containing protein [Clostridia bacterium]|nr:DUF4080 domain-containing protein [Clostridia bacterium]